MEDDKLAAYYDELTRKGGGAARFKQGLGFSSTASSSDNAVPSRGSALPTASSLLSSFVRASSPSKTAELDKRAQVQSIQDKLSRKPKKGTRSRSPARNPSIRSRSRSRSESRSRSPRRDSARDKYSRRRSRSRDRHSRRRSQSRDRRSRRRSRSREHESRRKNRSRSRSRERNRERSRRRGSSEGRRPDKSKKSGGGTEINFTQLIEGYSDMTPAERVKAKMKLQLSKTADNDETIGKGSGWERFDFNKDAPLDDEEIEAAEDDAVLVKHIGQSFRFSAVEAKREEKIKAAHDDAIFGGSSYPLPIETEDVEAQEEDHGKQNVAPVANLLSDQVLTMQQGSWRNRARKQ